MRRQQLLANNAVSRLASSITNTALSLSVLPGEGARFPSPTGGKYFRATIIKSGGTKEVIKVTARSTDTFTIQRAIEPVAGVQTAYAFSAGDKVELRVTSGLLEEEFNRLDAGLIEPLNKSASYTVTTDDASSLVRVNTGAGAVPIMLPSIASLPYDFDIIIAKVSSDGNVVTVDADGSDTINGAGTYNIGSQWQSVWLIADKTTNTWTAINSGANVGNAIVDTFVGAGSPGPFTLSKNPGSLNNIAVFVGGTWQEKATMLLSGTSLTLGGAVPSGVVVEVAYNVASIIEIGVPSDASVTTPKLGALAVTTAKIADDAVTTAKIADDAVTFDKLQNIATARLLGRASAGTGNAEELTGAQAAYLLTDKLQPLDATVAANTLAITLNPTTLDFRSTTLGSGAVGTRLVSSAISLVVPAGATLGATNAALSRLAVLAIDNGGTVELAVVNLAGGVNLNEEGVISTTAISAGATSASTIYSTTARTNVPYRLLGFIESTQTTAGTWATAPSLVHASDPLAKWMGGYGQTWQDVSGSRALATNYTNTTGRPIVVQYLLQGTAGAQATLTVGGQSIAVGGGINGAGNTSACSAVIPAGAVYNASNTNVTLTNWRELR